MFPQIGCITACIVTLVVFVWFFSTVGFQMCPQSVCIKGCKVTLVAFYVLFSNVYFRMFLQIACTRGFYFFYFAPSPQSHSLLCYTFLHYVLSNEPPNYLLKRMLSHTGYLLWTFIHCAFSNVSSNCLSKRMHSRIDCICLTFLRCVFSNGSSNGLPVNFDQFQREEIRCSIIFLTFLWQFLRKSIRQNCIMQVTCTYV